MVQTRSMTAKKMQEHPLEIQELDPDDMDLIESSVRKPPPLDDSDPWVVRYVGKDWDWNYDQSKLQKQTIEDPISRARMQVLDEDLIEIHHRLANYRAIPKMSSSLPGDVEKINQRFDNLEIDEDKSRAETIAVPETEPYKVKYERVIRQLSDGRRVSSLIRKEGSSLSHKSLELEKNKVSIPSTNLSQRASSVKQIEKSYPSKEELNRRTSRFKVEEIPSYEELKER